MALNAKRYEKKKKKERWLLRTRNIQNKRLNMRIKAKENGLKWCGSIRRREEYNDEKMSDWQGSLFLLVQLRLLYHVFDSPL